MHGSKELYASGYDEESLGEWATRVVAWAKGSEPTDAQRIDGKGHQQVRDVFVYFDNDAKVRAPFDAKALESRVNQFLLAILSH